MYLDCWRWNLDGVSQDGDQFCEVEFFVMLVHVFKEFFLPLRSSTSSLGETFGLDEFARSYGWRVVNRLVRKHLKT